ncbi:MAG: hypothetical protein KAR79_03735 [Simkaniaceae bacterium]|nr:hypothetical protein [Simkaniaceae bacterium]
MKNISKFCFALFVLTCAGWQPQAETYSSYAGENLKHYPAHYHIIVSVAIDGSSIEIEDGSQFKIPASQTYEVLNWRTNDPVVISPNTSCLSGCKYYLTNKERRSYVDANLYLGPIIGGNNTYRLAYINYHTGDVLLEIEGPYGQGNQLRFRVEPSEQYILHTWALNQAVIVGSNDSWFASWFSSCGHILINSEKNTFIRALEY